jgi:hypothetical protein
MVIDNGKKMSDESKRKKIEPSGFGCVWRQPLFVSIIIEGKSKAAAILIFYSEVNFALSPGNTLRLIMKVIPCGITFMHHAHLYTINFGTTKGVTVKKSKISCWLVSPAQRALKIFWTY